LRVKRRLARIHKKTKLMKASWIQKTSKAETQSLFLMRRKIKMLKIPNKNL
jgi:hypothetical protein